MLELSEMTDDVLAVPVAQLCHTPEVSLVDLEVSQSEGSDVFNGCDLGTTEVGTILDSGSSDGSSPVIIGTVSDDTGTHPGA